LIGVPIGLALMLAGIFAMREKSIVLGFVAALPGLVIYTWGCLALAKARGYSTALVITVVLGIIFPVVVLLALPDKEKHTRRR
jgi:hypothetical protein